MQRATIDACSNEAPDAISPLTMSRSSRLNLLPPARALTLHPQPSQIVARRPFSVERQLGDPRGNPTFELLIDRVVELRAEHPGMHVLHYAPHELRHHDFLRLRKRVRENGGSRMTYETWLKTGDDDQPETIRAYNEEDCTRPCRCVTGC